MADEPVAPEETAANAPRLRDRVESLKVEGKSRLDEVTARRPSARIAFDFYLRDRAFAGSLLAGGVAVKLFLWLLPFSLTFVVLLGTIAEGLQRPPEDVAESAGLTAALASMVSDAIETSSRARLVLGIFGVGLMIWAGIGVVRALRLVSRLAWGLQSMPSYNPVLASLALSGFMIVLLALQSGTRFLFRGPIVTDIMTIGIEALAAIAILTIAFRALPRPEGAAWQAVLPGAALVTIGALVIRLTTILYFGPRLATADAIYGGLGIAAVFLTWLYLIARILVAAISLNSSIWFRERSQEMG